jgi:hypothetical protein
MESAGIETREYDGCHAVVAALGAAGGSGMCTAGGGGAATTGLGAGGAGATCTATGGGLGGGGTGFTAAGAGGEACGAFQPTMDCHPGINSTAGMGWLGFALFSVAT